MKKGFLLCLLILGYFALYAQKDFVVRGKIKNIEDGVVTQLYRSSGRLLNVIASDTVRKGEFYFKLPAGQDAPEVLALIIRAPGFPNTWKEIWVAPGKTVKISGEGKLYRSWQVKSDIPEQKVANRFAGLAPELVKQQQQLMVKRDELYEQRDKMSAEEKKQSRKIAKELSSQGDSLRFLIMAKELELMQRTPVETVWLRKLEDISRTYQYRKDKFPYRKEVVALYSRLTDEQKQSEIGKNITTFLFPPKVVQIGEQMADADLFDLQGNVHHLSDYLGKFILLDFWSCGCGPCMMALPEMRKFAEANRDKVVVVSLSTDDKKNWEETSAKEKITWENLNDLQGESGLYAKYGVGAIPHYVVISPQGKILNTWNGYGKGIFRRKLQRLLQRVDYVMSVSQQGNEKIVEYPTEKPGGTETLAIDKVVLNDTATVLYMKGYYTPRYWIRIAKETHLVADDGTTCKLIHTKGITPDKKFVFPDSGEAEFVLTFEPLPAKAKSFDFIEGDCKECFKLFGIALE